MSNGDNGELGPGGVRVEEPETCGDIASQRLTLLLGGGGAIRPGVKAPRHCAGPAGSHILGKFIQDQ